MQNKYFGRPSMENVRDVAVITKQFILWAGLCDPKICGLCGCLALTLHPSVLLFAYLYCVTYLCTGSVSDNTIKLLVKLSVMLLSGVSYLSYYHLGLECICWSFILSQKFCYNLRTTFFRSRVRTNAHLGLVWTSVVSFNYIFHSSSYKGPSI